MIIDKSMNAFTIEGIKGQLHSHDKCRHFVEDSKDWKTLPKGPLREVFEEFYQEKGGMK